MCAMEAVAAVSDRAHALAGVALAQAQKFAGSYLLEQEMSTSLMEQALGMSRLMEQQQAELRVAHAECNQLRAELLHARDLLNTC